MLSSLPVYISFIFSVSKKAVINEHTDKVVKFFSQSFMLYCGLPDKRSALGHLPLHFNLLKNLLENVA